MKTDLEQHLGAFALAALDRATKIIANGDSTAEIHPSFMQVLTHGLEAAARLGIPSPFSGVYPAPVQMRSPAIPMLPSEDKLEAYMDKMGRFVDKMSGNPPEEPTERIEAEPFD